MKKNAENIFRGLFAAALLLTFCAGFAAVIRSVHAEGKLEKLLLDRDTREERITQILSKEDWTLAPERLLNKALDRRYYPEDDLLIRPDGQIVRGSDHIGSMDAAGRVRELYQVCQEEGRDFLYVLVPGKPMQDADLHEYGLSCYRNETSDRFVEKLEEYQVPYLDLRETIREEAAALGDPYVFFYKTDHHWSADGGLLAARTIAGELNARYDTGLKTEEIAPEAMEREVLEKPFVGEMGAALLGPYGESDHLVIRRPKKEVRLHYLAPQRKIDRTGDFDIIFAEKKLEKDFTSGKDNLYYYYMGSNDQLGSIENPDGGDSELLLIKDSFACVVMPFLALTAGKVTWWDMREDTAVFEYIREHPEIRTVILMYNTGFVPNSDMNDFS